MPYSEKSRKLATLHVSVASRPLCSATARPTTAHIVVENDALSCRARGPHPFLGWICYVPAAVGDVPVPAGNVTCALAGKSVKTSDGALLTQE